MASAVEDLAARVFAGDADGTVQRKLAAVRQYAADREDANPIDVLHDIDARRLEVFLRTNGEYVVQKISYAGRARRSARRQRSRR